MSTIWAPVISLDAVDVSASIVGVISVDAEESVSRIASFIMRPDAGTISAGDYLGVPVSIDYKTVDSSGVTLSQDRIFTGVVDKAVYDPVTRLTSFECTDDLQGSFEAMTQAAIDALIVNSRWAESVFGEYQDGWLYLEDLLTTYPQSYDYNADGVTGTLVDWAAKVTPDFSFDNTSIIDRSISYSVSPRRDLSNRYIIEYDYRFGRLKHREHSFSWHVFDFCTYFNQSHELPTKEMITNAVTGTGWNVQLPINFGMLPESAVTPCGGAGNWVISEELREQLATKAIWSVSRRWSQSVMEKYTVTVEAPQSIAWLGVVAYEEHASNTSDLDSDGWLDSNDTPTGRTDSLGDIVQDKYVRAISDNDLETLIARARTEILASHRANFVEANIELNPNIERLHTVQLSSSGVVGKGKVFKIDHSMDTDSGIAISKVRIAISLNGGAASGGDSAITAPVPPVSDPSGTVPGSSTILTTRIGNDDTAPVYDPSWTGFTGNYTIVVGTPTVDQIYPRQFRVTTEAVAQDAIDEIEGLKSDTYSFDIPDETLTITVT